MSEHVLVSDEWQLAVAGMVANLATDEFYASLCSGCELVSGYQSAFVVWLSTEHRPIYLYDDLPDDLADTTMKPWFDGVYLLDPFYEAFLKGAEEGVYGLQEVAPDNFYESEYYRSYYLSTGLVDEAGLMIRLDADHAVLLSFGSREVQGDALRGLEPLQTALPVLSALCRKQQSAGDGQITFAEPLDRAFRNFGRDHLSKRECEVVQLILKGHSNKSIAQLLDISVDTVKVFNKRFHAKLEISSQAELFSLFFESISMVPFDADVDPLTHYFEITGRK